MKRRRKKLLKKASRKLETLEQNIDRIIPYALVILLFIIIGDLFYAEELEPYDFYIHGVDIVIICIFLIDLGFKYRRSRNIPEFFKKHWLEIIAIFPFYLVLRLVEEVLLIARLSETFGEGQRILHEGVEVTRLSREAEITRAERLSRIFKPIQRVPRALESARFFE